MQKEINARLKRLYGNDKVTGRVKYRVVRSELQTEKRFGTYNEFYSGIFLRTTTGVKEVKKYWYFPACWVLERVEPNFDTHSLTEVKFTYEPILPFLTQDNKPIPLNWRAIETAIGAMNKMEKKVKTDEDYKQEEEAELKKEELEYRHKLEVDESLNPLPTFKDSVLVGKHTEKKGISE
jgi:hypothetical protein